MNRVRGHYQGYTIVETMIFLAVTSVLFVSVMLLVGGQQTKADFRQSVRDIDSKIQDVINDVSTGYYANTNNFTCTGVNAVTGQPIIGPGPNPQGANKDCIFSGRVIQFTNGSSYNIFTMVGRRIVPGTNQDVQSLYEAHPVPIERGVSENTSVPATASATEYEQLSNGLTVTKMYHGANNPANYIGAVGFFSTFATYSGLNISSGSTTTDMLPIAYSGSNITRSVPDMVDDIVRYLNPGIPTGSPAALNPQGGVTICFKSNGTDQYGVLTIGSNKRQLTTNISILDTATATAAGAACGP